MDSVAGLGWPDGPSAGAPGVPEREFPSAGEPAAEGTADVGTGLPGAGTRQVSVSGVPGASPGRAGLGWPGRTTLRAPPDPPAGAWPEGTQSPQEAPRAPTALDPPAEVRPPSGAWLAEATNSGLEAASEQDGAAEDDQMIDAGVGSARVRKALSAAVSRGTRPEAVDHVAPVPAGSPGADRGGSMTVKERPVRPVVVPAAPRGAEDTPIGRAAEAALVARGAMADQSWPRPRACRVVTIANQKGGVGKTTTAVNLAASLSLNGSRVLVVDLDPQGNASTALDVDHHAGVPSVYNVLVEDRPLAEVVRPVQGIPDLYCAPATIDLAGAEIELVPLVAREGRLARAVGRYDSSNLDYLLIDCPPSLGLLTVNALVAAEEVLIPIQCEYYALEGLEQLLRTVDLVRGHLNSGLRISTILLTMYDGRTRLAAQVADDVRTHFGDIVLQSIIPRSVRVSEAPSYGQSVITYDPGSTGALAYLEAAREVAAQNAREAG